MMANRVVFVGFVLVFSLFFIVQHGFSQIGMIQEPIISGQDHYDSDYIDFEAEGGDPSFVFQQSESGEEIKTVEQPTTKLSSRPEGSKGTEEASNDTRVSLDFKDADIRSILRIIALKSGTNIVASPEVVGAVTIRLDDVPWERALSVLLDTYGFGYVKKGNIISVSLLEKLTEQKRREQELAEVQPTITEVFELKYIDAIDAKNALEKLLSSRGKITVLEVTGRAGWSFAGDTFAKLIRKEKDRKSLSNVLVVVDIPPKIDEINEALKKIDKQPMQILIEAKIVEVSRDLLRDIGFDYTTGTTADMYTKASSDGIYRAGGAVMDGGSVLPAIFNPAATGLSPDAAGLNLAIKKIAGSQWEMVFHALEEDVRSNILSAPKILTLNNQEATILVGEKYPILKTTESEGSTTTQLSLDYYQDIGIQLNVVPQISGENQISMIIHPAVTSFTQTVGISPTLYPIIKTREAETQVIINDGETVVIGGLIKDEDNKENLGVPFLSKIPFLGVLFRRDTRDRAKIELLIFIKATIIRPDTMIGLTESDIAFLEAQASK